MKYNDLTIQKLRDLSILDVAIKLGFTLKGTGQEGRRALCPYHEDKHPSLHFSRKKNIFKCFVCGATGDLFKLVMDSENLTFPEACDWLVREFCISVVDDPPSNAVPKPVAAQPETFFRPLDDAFVQKSQSTNSLFCRSLVSTGYLTQQQMLHAANRYRLGQTKDGGVVFWEIDEQNQVHNGKIMYYQDNCHRDKTHTPSWVVAKLKSSGILPNEVENPHCLFGLHLLLGVAVGKIAIVESEKSAVILSELFPDYIWMASGGKTMLHADSFAPLGGHRIILFPDTDETGETFRLWSSIAQEATKLHKSRIHVSNLLEQHATPAQKSAKIDIVDLLFPNL